MKTTSSVLALVPWLISFAVASVPFAPRPSPRLTMRRANDVGKPLLSVPIHLRAGGAESPLPPGTRAAPFVEAPLRVPAGGASEPADGNDDEFDHIAVSKKLKNRNHTNLRRKFTHTAFGFLFAGLHHYFPRHYFLPPMTFLTVGTLVTEFLRYRRGFRWINRAYHFCLGNVLRKHEMEGKFTGAFYYFSGVLGSVYFFPKTASTMGILQLALADPSASYFGKNTRHVYWSRIENGLFGFGRNKGILGFLGGALFCFPFNYRIFKVARWGVGGAPGGDRAVATVSLLLGLAGALADLAVPTPPLTMPRKVLGIPMPHFHVDDNFVVPIFSSWACTKIFALVGWDDKLGLSKNIIF